MIPCGLVVRIRRFHRRGRGSIPRMGDFLFNFAMNQKKKKQSQQSRPEGGKPGKTNLFLPIGVGMALENTGSPNCALNVQKLIRNISKIIENECALTIKAPVVQWQNARLPFIPCSRARAARVRFPAGAILLNFFLSLSITISVQWLPL